MKVETMMKFTGLLLLTIILTCAGAAQRTPLPPKGAEFYYQETFRILDALKKDMPHISKTAEAAAALYVNGGADGEYGIGTDGDPVFIWEATSRAGGIAQLSKWNINPKDGPIKRGIILYCLLEGEQTAQHKTIAEWSKGGSHVIVFGRADLLQQLREAAVPVADTVTVPAAEHGGCFQAADGQWLLPTDQFAEISALWTWTGEFVAACTRLGKMPTMLKSIMVPGGKEWLEKHIKIKFHEEKPKAVKAGKLGNAWLKVSRKFLTAIHKKEMSHLQQVVTEAMAAQKAGHKLYVKAEGHGAGMVPAAPHDAKIFTPVAKDTSFKEGDFFLGMGYKDIFPDIAKQARDAKAGLAWSTATFQQETLAAILPGETLIDQQWSFGDAEVTVPGYSFKVFPVSGILNIAIYEMINAEMLAKQQQ